MKERSWDQKSFFQEIKVFNKILQFWSGDQQFDHEIKSLKRIVSNFQSHVQFVSCKYDHGIESLKSIISNFHSHERFVSHKCNHENESI